MFQTGDIETLVGDNLTKESFVAEERGEISGENAVFYVTKNLLVFSRVEMGKDVMTLMLQRKHKSFITKWLTTL